MRKKNFKPMIISALLAVSFGGLSVGTSFALFTDSADTSINVTAGKIDINAVAGNLHTYSCEANTAGDRIDENNARYNSVETSVLGVFTNGGTATLSSGNDTLTLDRVTPGDRVKFDVSVDASNTNVNFKYRINYAFVGQDSTLAEGLVTELKIGTADAERYEGLSSFTSSWVTATPGTSIPNVYFDIELPIDRGNEYQNKAAAFRVTIEAVQANAITTDSDSYTTLFAKNMISPTKTAAGEDLTLTATNATNDISVTTVIPAAATETGDTVQLVVSDITLSERPQDNTGKMNFDASLFVNGVESSTFSQPIQVTVKLKKYLEIISLTHNGSPVTGYTYDSSTGILSFTTTTFSPFEVVYEKMSRNVMYGFYDSYIEGEGQAAHWVHEVTNPAEYRNIFAHISAREALSAADTFNEGTVEKPLADVSTVYLLKNDIDFGGAIWTSGYLKVNHLPIFRGKLTADPLNPVKLSNVHNYEATSLSALSVDALEQNIDSDPKLYGLMGVARNAVIENIIVDDFILMDSSAKGASFITYGNYADDVKYKNDGGDLTIRNVVVNDTCRISGKSSLAAFVAQTNGYKNVTFDHCVNYANITGSAHAVAAFAAKASAGNGSGAVHSEGKDVHSFIDCANYGDIIGSYRVGGFIAYMNDGREAHFEGTNISAGNIFATSSTSYQGQIIGHRSDTAFSFGANAVLVLGATNPNLFVQNPSNVLNNDEYSVLSSHMVDKDGVAIDGTKYSSLCATNPLKTIDVSFDENDKLVLGNTPNANDVAYIYFSVDVSTVKSYYNGTDYPERVWGAVLQDHEIYSFNDFASETALENAVYRLNHVGYFLPQGATVYGDTLPVSLSQVHLLADNLKGLPAYTDGCHFLDDGHAYVVVTNENANGVYYNAVTHWRLRITYEVSMYDSNRNLLGYGSFYDGYVEQDVNESSLTAIPLN